MSPSATRRNSSPPSPRKPSPCRPSCLASCHHCEVDRKVQAISHGGARDNAGPVGTFTTPDIIAKDISFASDLKWTDATVGADNPVRRDVNLHNKSIRINGKLFEKGLGPTRSTTSGRHRVRHQRQEVLLQSHRRPGRPGREAAFSSRCWSTARPRPKARSCARTTHDIRVDVAGAKSRSPFASSTAATATDTTTPSGALPASLKPENRLTGRNDVGWAPPTIDHHMSIMVGGAHPTELHRSRSSRPARRTMTERSASAMKTWSIHPPRPGIGGHRICRLARRSRPRR